MSRSDELKTCGIPEISRQRQARLHCFPSNKDNNLPSRASPTQVCIEARDMGFVDS